jgi:tetratricopeptide (TPR) repeat protein
MRLLRLLFPSIILLASVIALASTGASAQAIRGGSAAPPRDAAQSFEEGQNAQQRGDLAGAVRLYTEAIAADSNLYQAFYQRATALMKLNRIADAESDLRKTIQLEPKFARAHRVLGLLLIDRDQTQESIKAFEKCIELDPKLTGVRIYLASGLIKVGQPAKAVEHLRLAIAQKEELPLAHALLGIALERTGNQDEAFTEYEAAIRIDPAAATAREGRARLFEARGEFARAIDDYTVAYRTQPSRDTALRLARLHSRAGQTQAAIGIYRVILLDKADDFAARAELALQLAKNGQAEEAEREIGVVLKSKPNEAAFQVIAGDLMFDDKPELAAGYYQKALSLDASNNSARVQLGASLVRAMRYEDALPILTDSIMREEGNYTAHANLATALFKLKRYPDAAREFIWLIRARPEIAASYYFLAISLDKLGDCQQAMKAYTEFVRRADAAAQKNEVEEANTRSAALQRLISEKKCGAPKKSK